MTWFEYHNAGNSEAQQLQAASFLFVQDSVGKATTGVLVGLGVAQTTTASASVVVSAGAGIVQAATLDGASLVGDVQDNTIDVLTGSPMGSVPRNDIVVADRATGSIRVIVGTANVTPTDPSVPSSAIKLARIRNAANATSVPSSAIDDLRVFTRVAGTSQPWQDYNPILYSDPLGTKTAISATKNYARYRYLDARTIQAQVSISRVAGSTISSLGVSLPVAGAFRSLNCGTLTIHGSTAPTAQSGVAVMSGDKTMLIPSAYSNGYLSVDPNLEIRFSIVYEV